MAVRISRRGVLGSAAGAAVAAAASGRRGVAAPSRPNILWLVSEDNNPFMGAYGDPLAHTPAIDRLAAEGILYRNVYSTAPTCAPSRFGIITGVLPESHAPAHNMRAMARLPNFLRGFPEYLRQVGYYCTNNAKTDYNCDLDPAAVWDRSGTTAHWRNRPPQSPFFAVFNIEATHESAIFKPTPGRVKPEEVRVPAYLPDTPEMRVAASSYYNCIEIMDGLVAARRAELDAAGVGDDTIIFYFSDNGGVLPRSKRYCYDEGLRCALVAYFPPRWIHLAAVKPGSTVDSPVCLVDLGPTMLSLAGIDPPAHLYGRPFLGQRRAEPRTYAFGMRNRMDERYDMVRTVSDGRFCYIRNYMPHRIWGQHQAFAWRVKGYQSWEAAYLAGRLNETQARFWRVKPFEEFYDLQNDRDQTHNLIGQSHIEQIGAMRQALDQHMLDVNDNGFIPEGSPLEDYAASRDAEAYPLKQIMQLAALAARRDPAQLDELRGHLDDPNEVKRYWTAQGLLMLERQAEPAAATLRRHLDEDNSPQVRIVVAEALAVLGQVGPAVAVLADLLAAHPHPAVRLQALNALTDLGPLARPALPAIEQAAASDDEYLIVAARYLHLVLNGEYTPTSTVYDPRIMAKQVKKERSE
jgi:arylsulfatase A-like enzyme